MLRSIIELSSRILMLLQRPRRVLEAEFRATVESRDRLLARVNRQVERRRLDLQAKGSTASSC
jgi:hypothetical protein